VRNQLIQFGFSESCLPYIPIGLYPEDDSHVDENVRSLGIDPDELRGKLIITIADRFGMVRAIGSLDPSLDSGSTRIHSGDTEFDSLPAYGLDFALRDNPKAEVLIVENPLRALLLQTIGYNNTIGLLPQDDPITEWWNQLRAEGVELTILSLDPTPGGDAKA